MIKNDETQTITNAGPRGSLGFPLQAAPVDRLAVGAARQGDQGVEASFGWGDLAKVAKSIAPIALSLL